MDVQKTMEFILQQRARAEGEMATMRQHQIAAQAKTDRQMAAIQKLIQTGMRLIVKNEQALKEIAASHKQTQKELRELAAAQKITDGKLRGLIDALQRGSNGSHRKK